MLCQYTSKILKSNKLPKFDILFLRASHKAILFDESQLDKNVKVVIIDHLGKENIGSLLEIIRLVKPTTISFLAQTASRDLWGAINQLQIGCPGATIGISCAIAATSELNDLDDSCPVVSFSHFADIILPTQLDVKCSEYMKIIPIATELAKEIEALRLPTAVEKILWLDNWMQQNVQYIKDAVTAGPAGTRFRCEGIERESIATDVLLNHYGVCSDIAASVTAVLSILGIPCEFVGDQNTCHSWVLVEVEGKRYILDCTHNITRNPNRLPNALKATKYSDSFTLVGYDTIPGKYCPLTELFENASSQSFSRSRIEGAKDTLSRLGVAFSYAHAVVAPSVLLEPKGEAELN